MLLSKANKKKKGRRGKGKKERCATPKVVRNSCLSPKQARKLCASPKVVRKECASPKEVEKACMSDEVARKLMLDAGKMCSDRAREIISSMTQDIVKQVREAIARPHAPSVASSNYTYTSAPSISSYAPSHSCPAPSRPRSVAACMRASPCI